MFLALLKVKPCFWHFDFPENQTMFLSFWLSCKPNLVIYPLNLVQTNPIVFLLNSRTNEHCVYLFTLLQTKHCLPFKLWFKPNIFSAFWTLVQTKLCVLDTKFVLYRSLKSRTNQTLCLPFWRSCKLSLSQSFYSPAKQKLCLPFRLSYKPNLTIYRLLKSEIVY